MRRLLFFFILQLVTSVAFSQTDSSGVYLTAGDFFKRKLAYPCDCKKQKHAIKLSSLFKYDEVIVLFEGKKIKLNKSDLFGFRDCEKKVYRFFHNTEYRIVSTLKIYLYYKAEETGTAKDQSTANQYFFSASPDSAIVPLTISNLKDAYPQNKKFHGLLNYSFKDDAELSFFEKSEKKYRLVQIYEESLK